MESNIPPPVVDTMVVSTGHTKLAPVSSTFSPAGELDAFPESAYSSPNSTRMSPSSPTEHTTQDADGSLGLSDQDPSSGPQRSRSASHSNSIPGSSESKEKRKRSRVTPEQLAHLERLFATDRSPTAARRKEISEMLGMQERQTQIWFQNRRAKAKLQESRREHGDGDNPPELAPSLSAGSDAELYYLVHEDEPISVIPCLELTIGSWKRMVSNLNRHDLVAYTCESQKRLTWYIHSAGQGFKIDIPFSFVVDTKFTNTPTPGMGQASFILSQPPIFYLESIVTVTDPATGTSTHRTWKRCQDWTEGMQASSILQHDLVGAAVQLAHVLRNIATSTAGPSIPLYPPTYQSSPHVSPMDVSSPQIVGMTSRGCAIPSQPPQFGYVDYSLKRRFSTPALMQPTSGRHIPTPPMSAYGPSPLESNASTMSMYTELSSIVAGSPGRNHGAFADSLSEDLPRLPISQSASRRSFAGSPTSYAETRQAMTSPYGARPSSLGHVRSSQSQSQTLSVQGPYLRSSTSWERPTSGVSPYAFDSGDMHMRADTPGESPPSSGGRMRYPH